VSALRGAKPGKNVALASRDNSAGRGYNSGQRAALDACASSIAGRWLTGAPASADMAAMSVIGETRGIVHRAARLALDALLPPQCLGCGAAVNESGSLCSACWEAVDFLGLPRCGTCGYPFEYEGSEGALCGACIRSPPAYDHARAVMRYDDASKNLILGFKHGDRTYAAPAFGRWLARAGAELLAGADLLVPVPLHWTRLFYRRYNQATLLAQAAAKASGVPAVVDLLVRRRRTPSQGRLSPAARTRNVRGAFAVRPGRAALVQGRRVVLIDDVLTTGATVEACARTLKKAGAAAVDVLTLARVVRPQP